MTKLGIVEGFFGPTWSQEARLRLPSFLSECGGGFYIYAPKRDAHLRKHWRENWPKSYQTELATLRDAFQSEGLSFGVALSPFGLGEKPSRDDLVLLKHRLDILQSLNIDHLGLFFDDMPSTPNLLNVQKQIINLALDYFPEGLIFCPSYYSYDPILDKVFGLRPDGYMEGLSSIPWEVEICWTGPKVISDVISREHLIEVRELLGRKPFIWENLYANDGPKNCKFLKLKYLTGRDDSLLTETNGVGFNLMNQPYLSQILYLSSLLSLRDGLAPQSAFESSCAKLLTAPMAEFVIRHREVLLNVGLDKMEEALKQSMLGELQEHFDGASFEIQQWLKGEYSVGAECLTD
jgi:hyaluronoglucosaminidase